MRVVFLLVIRDFCVSHPTVSHEDLDPLTDIDRLLRWRDDGYQSQASMYGGIAQEFVTDFREDLGLASTTSQLFPEWAPMGIVAPLSGLTAKSLPRRWVNPDVRTVQQPDEIVMREGLAPLTDTSRALSRLGVSQGDF